MDEIKGSLGIFSGLTSEASTRENADCLSEEREVEGGGALKLGYIENVASPRHPYFYISIFALVLIAAISSATLNLAHDYLRFYFQNILHLSNKGV